MLWDVSAPDLLVIFSFFQGSSLTSSPTTLFLVCPAFSKVLALISSAFFFSSSALALISFAALSLQPRLSHIFLQLLHQTLRAHQLLFRWPSFLLQPFFYVSLLEPGLHGLLQTSLKPRKGAQTLHSSGLRQFLPTVSLPPYFPLAGYTDQQLALLLLKDDRDLSPTTLE